MATAAPAPTPSKSALDHKLSKSPGMIGTVVFGLALLIGAIYTGSQLFTDLAGEKSGGGTYPYILLGIALFIALAFEFVNGFHDTANAVATVIYTHSLEPHIAVVVSGFFNFLGVLTSSGAVAFGIISLLPVELILQVGGGAGFAMVFALLVAAIIWNLGTWWLGLPASSSHTLVGSIIGVGIANQLMATSKTGTSGVDWAQATKIGQSLLLSPLVGFCVAGLLLLLLKALIKDVRLFTAPVGDAPPPAWIRGLLWLTCSGVSFFHGSNDGQKGMGLIMLILIGTVPTTYALNHAVPEKETQTFIAVSQQAAATLDKYTSDTAQIADAREDVTEFIRSGKPTEHTTRAMRLMINDISNELAIFKVLKNVPPERTRNFRNDMYVIDEALRIAQKKGSLKFSEADGKIMANYKKFLDNATKFIPTWVKVAVAIALGLGTMIGWKRIVITVGEKIGKDHLTYAQGASAEITAMITIGAADMYGLPVSTTHVLSSGVAGTMAANKSGLQWGTVRNLLMAWVLTLPCSIMISAFLFWFFSQIF